MHMPSSFVTRLTLDATRAAVARSFVAEIVEQHLPDHDPVPAMVVASELVANAAPHGPEPLNLELSLDERRLRIEVCDGDDRIEEVVARGPSPDAHGNGRSIVTEFADRWGVLPHDGGKLVWADVML